jgi:UDP-N-acetyl-D-mannosaminuronic acid dehydrogenase
MVANALREVPFADETPIATLCIVGLGYIGLPSATLFAQAGLTVHGCDINERIVTAVNSGVAPIVEPDLPDLLREVAATGRLTATTAPRPADAFLITVPTPAHHDTEHSPDISYVEAAARAIAPVLVAGNLVVLESTSPVGTTRHVLEIIRNLRRDLAVTDDDASDIDFAYSPERVIPGRTIVELRSNDRVIGGVTPGAAARACGLFGAIVRGAFLLTDDRSAELVKLTENAFRDVNIAFANEMAKVCDNLGLDVFNIIRLANHHPRVNILSPGPGVGGHCIAVDPWFIVASAPNATPLIQTARSTNDEKPGIVVEKAMAAIAGRPEATIACFGLTYKADVDDFRESPALEVALELTKRLPGRVIAVDPFADRLRERHAAAAARLAVVEADVAIETADVLLMLVNHDSFACLVPRPQQDMVDVIGWRAGRLRKF